MLIGLFFSQINVANAQNSPIEIVASYGEALSSFCSMNDIKYREKIEKMCVSETRVQDDILLQYLKKRSRTKKLTKGKDISYKLDTYLNMFQSMIINKSLKCEMSNVRVNKSLDEAQIKYYVTADMKYSGAINKESCYVFVVRDEKIWAIYSSSSSRGESIFDKIQDN